MNVSVVVPAWNAEETLSATLDSLLAQIHALWEAVVVDDGSTDGTAAIAREYACRDARIRLVQQENGGEAAARNAGLRVARHDWLLFLDSDDWIAPEHLKKLTSELAADPSLDAVHCGYARVAGDGTVVPESYQPPTGDMFAVWAHRSAFPVHACVVRRAIVSEVGGFDATLRKSADWDLWQRVARTGARFGAVREPLAFYRMRPQAASLEAPQMLRDGLCVLRRGHAPDPRVPRPHPDHAQGAPADQVRTQAWYLVSWCAGLMIGCGEDARCLIDLCDVGPYPELWPPGVAQAIFDAAPLPLCEPPRAWEQLWLRVHPRAREYLTALEEATGAPDLAGRAHASLLRSVLRVSPAFHSVADDLEASEIRSRELTDSVQQHEARIADLEAEVRTLAATRDELHRKTAELERARETLEPQVAELGRERDRLTAERDAIWHSPERRVGDMLLNRWRLRRVAEGGLRVARSLSQRLVLARLAAERWLARRRLVTTVCWNFPIHSHTFVYQELTHLAEHGFQVRLVYSKAEPRDQLPAQYGHLWPTRRRLFLERGTHERDFGHYRRRMPDRVESLIARLSEASGLSREQVEAHGNFLEAFTFTRMVEAYRPQYLHSYFFYDRSLMALVAAYLLEIPRGVSCYADHVMKDYELKVVPLHMELCDIVVATSARIRRELMELAPSVDPAKILVKPNGIDAARFPIFERSEPSDGDPYRLVSVCRIEPKKGLLDLVDAVHLLRERGVAVEAHLVGTPDEWSAASVEYKRRLDQRISELDLWGVVHLEGRQNLEGVLRFHRISHLFVAPFVETETGDKDGIPTALLEGMATGLPAVATTAGSITEVVQEDRDGLLVPERQPAALADAIQTLLAHPARRAEFGREAADNVRRRFHTDTCERIFHQRVDDLLRRKGA